MYVERLLQINIATLAALAALLLSMGEQNPMLPLGVALAAVGSVWLTDATGYFRLNRGVASLAAVAAVFLSLRGLGSLQSAGQLIALANLLVYLQIILLFQQKNLRVYWQLIMLSLLQVVVATAFNQGVLFGLLLTVYLFAGLSALALLFFHREGTRHGTAVPREVAGRELFVRLGAIGLGTLLLTAVVFFALPRLGRTAWRGAAVATKHLVGYSGKVTLGELGEIIESEEEVMRIQFDDGPSGDPYPVRGEVYLHGTVLTYYSAGQWEFQPARHRIRARPLEVARLDGAKLPSARQPVLQKMTIEPMDRPELFCVRPYVVTKPQPGVSVDRRRQRLLRSEGLRTTRFSFELGTTGFVDGVQFPLVPSQQIISNRFLLQVPRATVPRGGLPQLEALADSWIRQSGLPPEDRLGRARYIERQLRDSGRFQYSLQGQPRDVTIDPIEDFIVNNPRGHCEYFATALTLMLRSQGIPARMVIGYKCDEWNELGHFYQVRQRHAHTWVEAYLGPAGLPRELSRGQAHWDWAGGAWLRLDATPPSAGEPTSAAAKALVPLAKCADWLKYVWSNYVMEMDRSRQREAVYQPLVRWARQTARRLSDPQWWLGLWHALIGALNPAGWQLERWFNWRGVLVVVLALMLAPLAWRNCRRLIRAILARLTARPDSATAGVRARVDFYRRLEAVLARHGQVRPAALTPREFALAAGRRMAESTGQEQLAPLPELIVEAFYRVRFGQIPLDETQSEAVRAALEALEESSQSPSLP